MAILYLKLDGIAKENLDVYLFNEGQYFLVVFSLKSKNKWRGTQLITIRRFYKVFFPDDVCLMDVLLPCSLLESDAMLLWSRTDHYKVSSLDPW